MTDIDASYKHAGASFSETATRSSARRLRRTRQHLGSYRHDLLVAMRVVNSVEREMMRAEWENWLIDENTRCKQVQMMLRENRVSMSSSKRVAASGSQIGMDAEEKERRLQVFWRWHEEYCGSCRKEQDLLVQGRGNP